MGYTHYWKFKKTSENINDYDKLFEKSVKDAEKCIARIPRIIPKKSFRKVKTRYGEEWEQYEDGKTNFAIFGWDGTGSPVFTSEKISFNGDASVGNDHETFYIEKYDDGFNFCKTARKPYDVAVCVALLCFAHNFGDVFEYHSDGNIAKGEEGWGLAKKIVESYY